MNVSFGNREYVSMALLLALAMGAGCGLVWLFSQPATGRVEAIAINTEATKVAAVSLEAKSFRLKRPGHYIQKNTGVSSGDSFIFTRDGIHHTQIAIASDRLGDHNLIDEPSYKMRSSRPDTYRLEHRVVGGKSIPIFITHDGSEQVAYISDGDHVGTIAIVAADPDIVSVTELNLMIQTWSWK